MKIYNIYGRMIPDYFGKLMTQAKTVGFITGGQLARMMIEAFLPFRKREKIIVFDNHPDGPCSDLADKIVTGDSKNYDEILAFGKQCDVIILEFEHVNIQALRELEKLGKNIVTDVNSLEIIQCKGRQKNFFRKHNIPTADFFVVSGRADLEKKVTTFPFIQKTFRDGYDGGGVKKINHISEISESFDAESIVEECVNIQKEFSLIVGRDAMGNTFSYPLVEQFFNEETHIVKFVVSPAQVSDDLQNQAQKIGEKILENFMGVGIWAIELFLDETGKILVNEIAPRPHNSGHQSIEGNFTSQFAQCVRLALGYRAGNTEVIQPSIMWNLLGENNFSGNVFYEGIEAAMAMEKVYVHLYGKRETRPHRKMGHVTVLGDSVEECWEKIRKLEKVVRVKGETP